MTIIPGSATYDRETWHAQLGALDLAGILVLQTLFDAAHIHGTEARIAPLAVPSGPTFKDPEVSSRFWRRVPGLGAYGGLDREAGFALICGVRRDGGLDSVGHVPPGLPRRLVRLGLLRRPRHLRGPAERIPQFQYLGVGLVG
ncbi:hypothetical protein ACFZAV_16990 [Streptomyces sp. NPDC008343]|uniref:hypothetical protein n=1 Tax=Streptomyces sp. NPDC008343 TaxID=3364828 RepID=UPI0036EB9677